MAGADEIEGWFARAGLADWVEAAEAVASLCDRVEDAYERGCAPGGVVPDRLRMEGGEIGIDGARAAPDERALPRLHYLAPEGTAGASSDVYALGAILYRALTGELPFAGTNPIEVALAHRKSAVPRASRSRPGIPEAFDEAVGRAMAKLAEDRFPRPADLAAALREEIGGPIVRLEERYAPAGGVAAGPGAALQGPTAPRRAKALLALAICIAAAGIAAGTVLLRGGGHPSEPARASPREPTPVETVQPMDPPLPTLAPSPAPLRQEVAPSAGGGATTPARVRPASARPTPAPTPASASEPESHPLPPEPAPPAPTAAADPARLARLLAEAEGCLRERRLVAPPGDNAASRYRLVLEIDPRNETALGRLDFIRATYLELADARARDGDPAAARAHLEALRRVFPADEEIDRRVAAVNDEARRAASMGKLAIRVKPWGRVIVDGNPIGVTPLAPIALPAGRHEIEIVAEGRKPWSGSVVIEPGRASDLEVVLQEEGEEQG